MSATDTGRFVFRVGRTTNEAVEQPISIHWKIDSEAVSFRFRVHLAVRCDWACSGSDKVGSLSSATAPLTENGDTAEEFDLRFRADSFGDFVPHNCRASEKITLMLNCIRSHRNSPAVAPRDTEQTLIREDFQNSPGLYNESVCRRQLSDIS